MESRHFARIQKYYTEGYGMPKQFYSREELEQFVKVKLITAKERDRIIAEKGEPDAVL